MSSKRRKFETVNLKTNRSIHQFSLDANVKMKKIIDDEEDEPKEILFGKVRVFPPKHYKSKLKDAAKENNEAFALITFEIYNFSILIKLFQVIINDPNYRPLATKEEMDALKGMGKIILCKLLHYLLEEQIINIHYSVELEAMPYLSCNFDDDKNVFDFYERYTNEEAIDYLLQFPKMYEKFVNKTKFFDKIKDKSKIRRFLLYYMCFTTHLLSLIEYYRKLGFQTFIKEREYSDMVAMTSTVHTILQKC